MSILDVIDIRDLWICLGLVLLAVAISIIGVRATDRRIAYLAASLTLGLTTAVYVFLTAFVMRPH